MQPGHVLKTARSAVLSFGVFMVLFRKNSNTLPEADPATGPVIKTIQQLPNHRTVIRVHVHLDGATISTLRRECYDLVGEVVAARAAAESAARAAAAVGP